MAAAEGPVIHRKPHTTVKSSGVRVTFEAVRRIALSLPDVEEGTCWGVPGFRARGKLFAALREDLDSIVVRVSFEERDEMIADDPETYYTTDHHRNYPWVLVRRSKVHPDAIHDLLKLAWRSAMVKARKKVSARGPGREI